MNSFLAVSLYEYIAQEKSIGSEYLGVGKESVTETALSIERR
jgi:hypothetical protein